MLARLAAIETLVKALRGMGIIMGGDLDD